MEALGGCALLIIDTSAAYFAGDNENDNVSSASMHPICASCAFQAVPAPHHCHPPKNAPDDNLLPRGGGAFLAEIDGNLTAIKEAMTIKNHWQGKFRGPEFEPITSSRAPAANALEIARGGPSGRFSQNTCPTKPKNKWPKWRALRKTDFLKTSPPRPGLNRRPRTSHGWLTQKGQPKKSKVFRALERLKSSKLVKMVRGRIVLTEEGKKAMKGELERGEGDDETGD